MKLGKSIIVAFFLFLTLWNARATCANPVERGKNETVEEFVMRFAPSDSKIVHKIIQTSNWLSNHNAIIVFYEHPDTRFNKNQSSEGDQLVTGMLFVQNSSQQYNMYLIGHYEIEGVTAEINSVFFEKVGKAHEKDLFVMVSWTTRNNAVYSTYIYEPPVMDSKTDKLVYLEDLSKQFFSMELGPDQRAIYTTASEIRAALKKMNN